MDTKALESIHIYPLNDLMEHITNGNIVCGCFPRYKEVEGGILIIHNSWDGREFFEENQSKNGRLL